jgi:large subunit ribosomal protein L32
MPIPKQRHTSSRRNRRRAQLGLKKTNLSFCAHCGESVLPHIVCSNCGYYNNRQVIDVFAKLDKKEKKQKVKELSKQEKDAQDNKPLDIENLSKK